MIRTQPGHIKRKFDILVTKPLEAMVKDEKYSPSNINPLLSELTQRGLITEQKRLFHRFLFHVRHEIKTPPTDEETRLYIDPVKQALIDLDETIKNA